MKLYGAIIYVYINELLHWTLMFETSNDVNKCLVRNMSSCNHIIELDAVESFPCRQEHIFLQKLFLDVKNSLSCRSCTNQ